LRTLDFHRRELRPSRDQQCCGYGPEQDQRAVPGRPASCWAGHSVEEPPCSAHHARRGWIIAILAEGKQASKQERDGWRGPKGAANFSKAAQDSIISGCLHVLLQYLHVQPLALHSPHFRSCVSTAAQQTEPQQGPSLRGGM
jgi:hypothetical protein